MDIKCSYWSRGCRRAVVILPREIYSGSRTLTVADDNDYPRTDSYSVPSDNTNNDSTNSR